MAFERNDYKDVFDKDFFIPIGQRVEEDVEKCEKVVDYLSVSLNIFYNILEKTENWGVPIFNDKFTVDDLQFFLFPAT